MLVARPVSIFSRTRFAPWREGGFEMATEQEKKKPQETREAGTERKFERKPPAPNEAHEGTPGYGQPPEEVREKHLPEQNW
jgi:hypothetical protein